MSRFDRISARLDARAMRRLGDGLELKSGATLPGILDIEETDDGQVIGTRRVLLVSPEMARQLQRGDEFLVIKTGEWLRLRDSHPAIDGLVAFEVEVAP